MYMISDCRVYLLPLTFDKPIVEKVYLKDMGTGRVKGSIFVKIFWDGLEMPENEMNEFNRVSFIDYRPGKMESVEESLEK